MWYFKYSLFTTLFIILFSCNSTDNITTYKIKKPATLQLKWIAPKIWEEQNPGNMLLANFYAFDSKNESINISISMFPGDVGGLRNNIDRWRNQIGLKQFDPQNSINLNQKISPEEDIQNITLPLLGNAQMVHLNNNENNKSIKVIVIPNQNGQTIFVKMNGNINGVLELENDFSLFYQSIYWGN